MTRAFLSLTVWAFCSPFLQPSDIIRTTQHATPFHHLPFSVRSFSSPSPSYLIPPATLPPSLPPSSFSFLGPCAGGAITEGGIDSFALMWFGLQRGTAQSNTFSQRTELLSLLCLQFMCFQTGQSTPLSCAGLSLPLPPTISALSVSVKSHQSSLSHTHTLLSLVANSNGQTVPFFCFHCPYFLQFIPLQTHFQYHISVFLCCFVICIILLILSSTDLSTLSFPLQAKPAIGHIAISDLYKTQPPTKSHNHQP